MLRLEGDGTLKAQHRVEIGGRCGWIGIGVGILLFIVQIIELQYFSAFQNAIHLHCVVHGQVAISRPIKQIQQVEAFHHVHHRKRSRSQRGQHLAFGIHAMHIAHIVMVFLAGGKKSHDKQDR